MRLRVLALVVLSIIAGCTSNLVPMEGTPTVAPTIQLLTLTPLPYFVDPPIFEGLPSRIRNFELGAFDSRSCPPSSIYGTITSENDWVKIENQETFTASSGEWIQVRRHMGERNEAYLYFADRDHFHMSFGPETLFSSPLIYENTDGTFLVTGPLYILYCRGDIYVYKKQFEYEVILSYIPDY